MFKETLFANIDTINRPKEKGATSYMTHNFHTYPAKFIPQIPEFSILNYTNENDVVLDPFVGCGTTLVEAKLLNRKGIGVDLNPIATLLSFVKTTSLNNDEVSLITNIIEKIKKEIDAYYELDKTTIKYTIPVFYNIDHWFQKNVQNELALALSVTEQIKNEKVKNFIKIAISSIIVKVSNQESDTRFAAINKNIKNKEFIFLLDKKINEMVERIIHFSSIASKSNTTIYKANSENLSFLKENSVDHIVTSPPYANTYDYYLYHKFRMYWLGFDVKKVKHEEIGSRDKHSSQKKDIKDFIISLTNCMNEFHRVLKPNKYALIVIGDSIIRGKHYKADEFFKKIAKQTGFEFLQNFSYNLQKNTRLFNPKFTNSKKSEHIMLFKNME